MKSARKYKTVIFPIVVICLLLMMLVGVANFLWGEINETRSKIQAAKSKNAVLEERLTVLQGVDSQVRQNVIEASLAIPEKTTSVLVTRQLKNLAIKWNISISNLSVISEAPRDSLAVPGQEGQEPQNELKRYLISFKLIGEHKSILDFVDNLSRITPIVNLDKILLKESNRGDSLKTADVSLTSFSAPFPSVLPAIDQPIVSLTNEELETLGLVNGFEVPEITPRTQEPTEIVPRENPFSLGN